MGFVGKVRALDPAKALDPVTKTALACVLDGLYEYDNNGKIYPRLASGMPIQDSPLRWRIPVRQGVRFHNNALLTASDVAFSIRRLIGERRALRKGDLFDFLKGAQEQPGNVVEIVLHYPVPNLLEYLTRIEFAPVNRRECLLAGDAFGAVSLSGTGPFMVRSKQGTESLVLESNPGYWMSRQGLNRLLATGKLTEPSERSEALAETGTGGRFVFGETIPPIPDDESRLPSLGKISFEAFSSYRTMQQAIDGGKINAVVEIPPRYAARFRQAEGTLREEPSSRVAQIYLNTVHPPLHRSEIRQAVSQLIDRTALCTGHLNDTASPAHSPFPQWSKGRAPSFSGQTQNADEARATLNAAGYTVERPLHVEVLYSEDFTIGHILEGLLAQLADEPVYLVGRELSRKELFNRVYGRGEHNLATYEAALEDWQDYRGGVNPLQFVTELYHSASTKNKIRLADPEVDSLIDCLQTAETEAEFASLLQDLERRVTDDHNTIYLCWMKTFWMTRTLSNAGWSPHGWVMLKDSY